MGANERWPSVSKRGETVLDSVADWVREGTIDCMRACSSTVSRCV